MTSRIYDTAFRDKCRDDTSAPTEGNAVANLGQELDPEKLANICFYLSYHTKNYFAIGWAYVFSPSQEENRENNRHSN